MTPEEKDKLVEQTVNGVLEQTLDALIEYVTLPRPKDPGPLTVSFHLGQDSIIELIKGFKENLLNAKP